MLTIASSAPIVEMKDYISLGGAIIIALLGAAGGYWQWVLNPKLKAQAEAQAAAARRLKDQDDKLDTILANVQNSHTTNLRDDLDRQFAQIREDIRKGDARTHRRIDQLTERFDRHVDRP